MPREELVLVLFLSVLASITQTSRAQPASITNGISSCPCISSWADVGADSTPFQMPGGLRVNLAGREYSYLPGYGLSQCVQHDAGLQPYCNAANVSERPAWCQDSWCYVDENDCSLPTTVSAYFETGGRLRYSYTTCGATNSFTNWFGANAGAEVRSLSDLLTLTTGYLKSMVDELEHNQFELEGTSPSCTAQGSCPCDDCTPNAFWSEPPPATPQNVTFDHETLTTMVTTDKSSPVAKIDECQANVLGSSFRRIAAKEADPSSRIGYAYYGAQAVGSYVQWPGISWCPTTYDSRYRPWYTTGASGPKDVVIVVDTSGSMDGTREQMAREAATRVVGTLTDADYATVIAFSDNADAYSSALTQATSSNKDSMVAWINENIGASGGTNFRRAFEKVWEVLDQTGSMTTGCNQVILFLSDGKPSEWDDSDFASVTGRASSNRVALLTFALSSGAEAGVLKRLACENDGIFYAVPDNGPLADTMASYYSLLGALLRPCATRYVPYNDWFTGQELLASCLAAFEKSAAGDPSSCDGGLSGLGDSGDNRVPKLIGVACLDFGELRTPPNPVRHHPTLPAPPPPSACQARAHAHAAYRARLR